MLRGNYKIWAVVVLVCIIAQFVTATLPGIVETFDAMDTEYEQKLEEEKAKIPEATVPAATEPVETEPIVEPTVSETIGNGAESNVESDQLANGEAQDSTDGEESAGALGILIVFAVFFIAFMLFILVG